MLPLPYCGSPPSPGALLARFNLDPVLIVTLLCIAALHVLCLAREGRAARAYAAGGWLLASAALISPLCALSVSLFSARVGQHMILVLAAAPLIALGLPRRSLNTGTLWAAVGAFTLALWLWHMPAPYEATFSSTLLYWVMHITLFGSAILLWKGLIDHPAQRTGSVLAAGLATSMQMGLLGAVLALGQRPLFAPHLLTTQVWGLTPLQDQQLGGALMWVPGILLYLWVATRSLQRLWKRHEGMTRNELHPARLP